MISRCVSFFTVVYQAVSYVNPIQQNVLLSRVREHSSFLLMNWRKDG